MLTFVLGVLHIIMKSITVLFAIGSFANLFSATSAQLSNVTTPTLNLTTIAAVNGSSVLQCWQFPEFMASAQAGTAGALNLFLGDMANASYTVVPPRFNGGLHTAPSAQYVFLACTILYQTIQEFSSCSCWLRRSRLSNNSSD